MVSHGVGVVLVQMSCYPLVFLPCDCAASPSGLGWRVLAAYSSSGPAACAAFLAAGYLRVFRSPGVCTSASLVTWVGLQPFPSFSGLLLLRLLVGVVGVLHPVSGCSS